MKDNTKFSVIRIVAYWNDTVEQKFFRLYRNRVTWVSDRSKATKVTKNDAESYKRYFENDIVGNAKLRIKDDARLIIYDYN